MYCMDITRVVIFISIFVFLFGLYQAAHAETLDSVIVDFNQTALAAGYTVESMDKEFHLAILPNQFKNQLMVRVDETLPNNKLPEGKQAVSGFYRYEIKSGQNDLLVKPIILLFDYGQKSVYDGEAYFYDKGEERWRPLASVIEKKYKRIKVKTLFPSAEVVILEDVPGTLTAKSAIVIDNDSGSIVFEKNTDEVRPVASLTKLMTVLVFFDHNPGWNEIITMKKSDYVGGGMLWVKEGTKISVKDLFYATLVGSRNNTAEALARSTGLTRPEFIKEMNKKTETMGLTKTHFVDPTGLDEKNVSTAYEMAEIAKAAFANKEVLKATTAKLYKVKPLNSKFTYLVKNTSQKVLDRDLFVTGSKTGWTDEAGYNLVTQAKSEGKEMIALVMGAKVTRNYEEVYELLKKYL